MSTSLQSKEHHDLNDQDHDISPVQVSPVLRPSHSFLPGPKRDSESGCGKDKGSAGSKHNLSKNGSFHVELPLSLHWIRLNWTWLGWTPAIRCAVAEWASLLLLIINPSTRAMGQVGLITWFGKTLFSPLSGWFFDLGRYVGFRPVHRNHR